MQIIPYAPFYHLIGAYKRACEPRELLAAPDNTKNNCSFTDIYSAQLHDIAWTVQHASRAVSPCSGSVRDQNAAH